MLKYILALLFLLGASPAFACSCAGPSLPKDAYKDAKEIFSAHVTVTQRSDKNQPMEFQLKRDRQWKGETPGTITLGLPLHGCAFWNFEDNKDYLIYMGEDGHISSCSRTKMLERAQIETQYLDAIAAGKEPEIDATLPQLLLNGESENMRAEAARLISEILLRGKSNQKPDENIAHALMRATMDKSPLVRVAAVQTLGNYRLSGVEGRKDALIAALKDDDRDVRAAAVGTFGMVGAGDSRVFQALVGALKAARADPNPNIERQESLLWGFSRGLAEWAATEEEKDEAVTLLRSLVDEIKNPYSRVGAIQHLGFMRARAKGAANQLLQVLDSTEADHVTQYTIIALGDIGASETQPKIEPYLKHANCYIAQATVQAVYKMNKEGFKTFFTEKAMPEMKSRFDKCAAEFAWGLQAMAPAGREMEPFIAEKHAAMPDGDWKKSTLKTLLDTWKNAPK